MEEVKKSKIDQLGIETFGSKEKYLHWFTTPHIALGKQKPVDLVKTPEGREEVYAALIRINYGILA